MAIDTKLKQIGLHDSEIKAYLFLLENGIATPSQIARGTGIARPNCYHLVNELQVKGLIVEQTKGKRKAYAARDPQALLSSIDRKKEIIEELLPDLRGIFVRQKHKPKIQFFEGWEEVKQIYEQSLSAEKIVAIGSIKKLDALDKNFFAKYQKGIGKRRIIFQDILSGETAKVMERAKSIIGDLYTTKSMPLRYRENPTDILIWGDNIAFISLEEPIFGTVLTNPFLAQTLKTIFEILWEKL